MRILYFAWVRETIGTGEEMLDVPGQVTTIASLIDWLSTRSDGHARAFADRSRVRAAVDQDFVDAEASIVDATEVALFPPVTGG